MTFKIVKFDQGIEQLGVKVPGFVLQSLYRFLKLPHTDELVYQAKQVSTQTAVNSGFALKYLNITYDFDLSQLQPYLNQRNLIVCNHPTGFLEVFILMDLLHRAGFNFRFLANDFIKIIPGVEDIVIPVDVYSDDRYTRLHSVRKIMSCFNEGLSMAAFPSGAVARFCWKSFKVKEQPWNQNLLDLGKRAGAGIIRLNIQARNSALFYLSAMSHPMFPSMMLFREYFKKENKHFTVTLEEVIPAP